MFNTRMDNLDRGRAQAEMFAVHWNNLRRGHVQQENDND